KKRTNDHEATRITETLLAIGADELFG
ncbi:MAG: hypothetical protein JWN39_3118, partial [Ilumatobacteraceae bacterium]|nr:hypothetical protein [Ilumatobacteraceae bacterium]